MAEAAWLAFGLAAVSLASVASLVVFFVVGGPFGLLNDIGNALIGVLCALVAMSIAGQGGGWLGVVAAVLGAAVSAWGSWLVVSGATGFVFAGFVSTIGFGLIGIWLALVAWSPLVDDWSDLLRGLARVAAVAMLAGGLAAVPAAVLRIDAYDQLPAWLWTFSLAWLGTYVILPVVAFGLGRRLIGS